MKLRYVFFKEGEIYNGTYFLPGSISLPTGSRNIVKDRKVVGKADKFRRDENTGEISAEIEIFDDEVVSNLIPSFSLSEGYKA